MPRPKKPGAPEPKRRSRNGSSSWPIIKSGVDVTNQLFKALQKQKDQMRGGTPELLELSIWSCFANAGPSCQRAGEHCDYSIRLNWDGRRGKRPEPEGVDPGAASAPSSSSSIPAKGFKLVHQFPATASSRVVKGKATTTSSPVGEATVTTPQSSSGDQRPGSNKRIKLDSKAAADAAADQGPLFSLSSARDAVPPSFRWALPVVPSATSPDTPTTASTYSDDDAGQTPRSDRLSVTSPDIRRMSVHSLLSGPPGLQGSQDDYASPSSLHSSNTHTSQSSQTRYYGIDRGLPDLDLGKNDDGNAISSGESPFGQRDRMETPFGDFDTDQLFSAEFGFGVDMDDATEKTGGYYDKPVSIYIPPHLEPLPPKLLNNPMNLLYFHHFINNTARVLVPYDDPQANPFRNTLPLMAVKNDDLLALVLAYSASHRARVLKHPEPELRIATWVTDIFPTLRQALSDPRKNFSDANLASAIMLASLEIVSPKIFGYSIPWQKHLSLARELITARPGGLHYQGNFRQDNVCSFLWSWAAYLDVIGSLSGGPKDSSTAWMFDYEIEDRSDGYDEIDCIMGFTTRCVYLLAKIADLARKCDAERLALQQQHHATAGWKPDPETLALGLKLEADIKESMSQPPRPCKHIHTKGNLEKWGRVGLAATNKAFHWAGLIHIYRRILGRPSNDQDVQTGVKKIIECFDSIRRHGTSEQSMLFPTFTAGCDALEESQRAFILERFETGEVHGMTQVRKARKLMLKVWETGQPWETLLSTEFIG
ncbi:hypothetical protein PG996_000829 [Apiospora saccharicola]|uniref:Uncharacterized protein n=1 Tax=Apiospora saccharicola TaxID=335842 RepID=A0ABR1WEU7_9PEZI